MDLQVDDLADLELGQPMEDHCLVDAIEELGSESLPQHTIDPIADLVVGELVEHKLGPRIRGHDQHRVRKVDGASLAVGQTTVIEHLQQDVEDVAVCFLDLVEQDDGVWAASNRLGQLATLVIADVAGRRTDETRDGVAFHVLRHIDPDHRLFVVKEQFGERLSELGLADTGRAKEEERPNRSIGITKPCARATDRVGDGGDGLFLPNEALVKTLLELHKLLHLAFHQARHGNPCPSADDLGDVFLVDLFFEHRAILLSLVKRRRLGQ